MKKKSITLEKLYPLFILIVTILMSIGYASINLVNINLSGKIKSKKNEGIYITDVKYSSNIEADLNNSKILSAYQTNLNSEIMLSKTNNQSSITYEVTIYNSTEYDYYFMYVDYMLGDITYDNEEISFNLDGLVENQKLSSKSNVTFKITFNYTNDVSENNKLKSILNFVFNNSGTLINSGKSSYSIFGNSISRTSIEEVYTVNNIDIPSNAVKSWDASLGKDGTIFAWTIDKDKNGKYELYIGAENGQINLPEDSSYMFYGCDDIKYMDLKYFKTFNVKNMKSMFEDVGKSSKQLKINGLEYWNTYNLTNMENMFKYAGNNASVFEVNVGNFYTTNVINMKNMFQNSGEDSTNWSIGDLSKKEVNSLENKKIYIAWDVQNVETTEYMFNEAAISAENISLNLNNWNIYSNIDMNGMFELFANESKRINISINNLNINKEANMANMFEEMGESSSTVVFSGLESWKVSNVINMSDMFRRCGMDADTFSLGDLSKWDTSKVTNMSYMFSNTGKNAKWNLDCSSWNVLNVTNHRNFNENISSKVIQPNWK